MIEIRTPSRLHFGLLAYSRDDQRQFGGAGLMVRQPETLIRIRATGGQGFTASGRMADRALALADRFAAAALQRGWGELGGAAIEVLRVPRPHTGLGSGTQLGMAIGRGLAQLYEREGLSPQELAGLVGRGKRSAIGVHGFHQGGFLVEGGKSDAARLSPLVMRQTFPEDWRIVLVRPRSLEGLAGQRENDAFQDMPAIPADLTARMCRLVLLGLAPALIEQDLPSFGEALYELQQLAGQCFAAAQGGIYADKLLADIVQFIRQRGVRGVGQSSWGPTLYAVVRDEESAERLAAEVEEYFALHQAGEVIVTAADNQGAAVRALSMSSEK